MLDMGDSAKDTDIMREDRSMRRPSYMPGGRVILLCRMDVLFRIARSFLPQHAMKNKKYYVFFIKQIKHKADED